MSLVCSSIQVIACYWGKSNGKFDCALLRRHIQQTQTLPESKGYDARTWKNDLSFSMCNGPTNALVCNKTLIQLSHIKTLKITPTCFDHQLIIIRELFDPG
jgi:hypothetical protein